MDYDIGGIYKNQEGHDLLLKSYDEMQSKLKNSFEDEYVCTRFGKTHLLVSGPTYGKPIFILYSGSVINPVNLRRFEDLAKDYRIFSPDIIGCPGKSSEVIPCNREDDYANWIKDIMNNLGIKKAHFIGVSYGGGMVLNFAARSPNMIDKAVFVSPSTFENENKLKLLKYFLIPLIKYKRTNKRENLVNAYKNVMDGELEEEFINLMEVIYKNVKVQRNFPKSAIKKSKLTNFKSESLLIAGKNDILFPSEKIISKGKDILPNLKKFIEMDSKHYITKEKFTRALGEINSFLKEDDDYYLNWGRYKVEKA